MEKKQKSLSRFERCKQIDIVSFARSKGLTVVKKGNDFRLEDHDSFVFSQKKQRFYWNSQNISGDIIDLAKLFFVDENITNEKQRLTAAINVILNEETHIDKVEDLHFEREPYQDHPEDYQKLSLQGRRYLINERKLPAKLIDTLERNGLIAELKPRTDRKKYLVRDDRLDHAIAFIWKDLETKETVGASYQGILLDYDRFGDRGTYKHIDKDPTPNHAFNWLIGSPKNLKFFESSIDLCSYAALNREHLKDTWLIAMEGLKHNVIDHYFGEAVRQLGPKDDFPGSIEVCVDNDAAGHIFFESVQRLGRANPFTGEIVKCESGIANDWQIDKAFKPVYEKVAGKYEIDPEALMAIHKTETNLQLNQRLATKRDFDSVFGRKLAPNELPEPIDLTEKCEQCAARLRACKIAEGKYDFDQFYKKTSLSAETQILLSIKAEKYYGGYKEHHHEWVSDVKKDWNDQLKHEVAQQELRRQQRALLFKKEQQRTLLTQHGDKEF